MILSTVEQLFEGHTTCGPRIKLAKVSKKGGIKGPGVSDMLNHLYSVQETYPYHPPPT